ncbi:hypothetical protein EV421DRAFT_1732584 [Armillaria borealis]|uniref:Uncharacterized protein n=1 Tax=Armillaria borealis TaxID=47425 RepID=A0AA39JVF6_9AGAR|nr:hypothetical protein EV421DRAFT_1732584 [Armillaria borealis]
MYVISPCTWLRDDIQRASAILCLLESEIACLPKLVVGAGGRVQRIMGFTGTPSDLGYECHINSALSQSSRASVARSRGELEDCTALFSNERISDGIKIIERDPPVFDDDDDQHHDCGAICGLDSYPVESMLGPDTQEEARSSEANFSEEMADDQVATLAGGLRTFESCFENLYRALILVEQIALQRAMRITIKSKSKGTITNHVKEEGFVSDDAAKVEVESFELRYFFKRGDELEIELERQTESAFMDKSL